jgi:transcriptional regulator with XRE-family HTH domain
MSQNQLEKERLAERLLITRRRAGLSQSEFAERVGVSPRAYRNYELALRDPPVDLIVGIHRAFGTELYWLLLGTEAQTSADLGPLLLKAKDYAERYIKSSDRVFDEERRTLVEAKLLSQLLSDAGDGEKMLKFLLEGKFDE